MTNVLTSGLASTTRSLIRQLEDLLPQIEDGLAQGYSHAAMHAALPALGINITLAYYHRSLRLLRKEKREGKRTRPAGTLAAVDLQDMRILNAPSTVGSVSNLSTALSEKPSVTTGNITAEKPQTQPFRWKGQDFLNKDWSNF